MWKYWDWEEIREKYVKHTSRVLFLLLIFILIHSIFDRASFDQLNVYNFTSKRPELVYLYEIIVIPALPHLQRALLLCLIIIIPLIIISWKPDTKNSRFFNLLYDFLLILLGLIVLSYMLAIILFLKSTCKWFAYFVFIIILVILTLIINHLYYKKNIDKFDVLSKGKKILLSVIILSVIVLEIVVATPKVIESKKALKAYFERACNNLIYNSYSDIFSENYDPNSKYFTDIREELQTGSKAYVILNFINLYSTEENNFTAEEIIKCYNDLEHTDLDPNSSSWNRLLQLYDANSSAKNNSKHLEKYNIYKSPLRSGYTAKHCFYENVHRRLHELGYTTTMQIEDIDKEIVNEACKYVYDIFESGLYEPIKEVNLKAELINGEYILTTEDNSLYFISGSSTKNDEEKIRLFLRHSVGYYFDENTIINIEGIGNYTITDIVFEYEPGNEYKYADIKFSINIK